MGFLFGLQEGGFRMCFYIHARSLKTMSIWYYKSNQSILIQPIFKSIDQTGTVIGWRLDGSIRLFLKPWSQYNFIGINQEIHFLKLKYSFKRIRNIFLMTKHNLFIKLCVDQSFENHLKWFLKSYTWHRII